MPIELYGLLEAGKEGGAGEAVKGKPEHEGEPVILGVDASKLQERELE